MKPLKVLCSFARAGPWSETAVAVLLEQVLDDGSRLEQRDVAVLNGRYSPEWAQGSVLRSIEIGEVEWNALVRDLELVEEPEDAHRACPVDVMNFDHRSAPAKSGS
jgi:hypothetical protein